MSKSVMKTSLVVTTIQKPNKVMKALASGAESVGWNFIVVGDEKSPEKFELQYCNYLDITQQKKIDLELARNHLFPKNHYARKNLGYLLAIKGGSQAIVETDDDNFPLSNFFESRDDNLSVRQPTEKGWINAYRYFTSAFIWPRGFPLDEIKAEPPSLGRAENQKIGVIQGLAQGNPDVDAIYRLTSELPFDFKYLNEPIALSAGQYCPTNSQNTTHFRDSFPLMYLPSFCSFRMTDIWRGLISQRVLAEAGFHTAFASPSVYQERNQHDLMVDFRDEIEGYLNYSPLVRALDETKLQSGVANLGKNLLTCYQALVEAGFFPSEELELVHSWLNDIDTLSKA